MPGNIWVGCTSAQSQWGRPWPAPRPFAWILIALWFVMLLGHVIPFWKGFDKANWMLRAEFWFRAWVGSCGCWKGGGNFFEKFAILNKKDPTWNWILRDVYIFVFDLSYRFPCYGGSMLAIRCFGKCGITYELKSEWNFQGLKGWLQVTFGCVVPPAQSPPGSTWLAPGPFPWGGAALWSSMLPGCVMPFWKALDKPNNIVQSDFVILDLGPELLASRGVPGGGG